MNVVSQKRSNNLQHCVHQTDNVKHSSNHGQKHPWKGKQYVSLLSIGEIGPNYPRNASRTALLKGFYLGYLAVFRSRRNGRTHFSNKQLCCWHSQQKRYTFPLKALQSLEIYPRLTGKDVLPQSRERLDFVTRYEEG